MLDKQFAIRLFEYSGRYKEVLDCHTVHIYGAGEIGQAFCEFLQTNANFIGRIADFVVSDSVVITDSYINSVKVRHLCDAAIRKTDIVVLAAEKKKRDEMERWCEQIDIKNILHVTELDGGEMIEYFKDVPEDKCEEELKKWYFAYTGEELDLEHPRSFNEKIQWLKLYDDDPRKIKLADKYAVREYVRAIIGMRYLIPLLGRWDKFEEIDFELLPSKFVLKCVHGSGWNYIVTDKNEIDYNKLKKKFDKWMKCDLSLCSLEKHYHYIAPAIIAEEYLEDPTGDLRDYKFWCFDGKVKLIQVDMGRYTDHKRNFYTTKWEFLDVSVMIENDPSLIESRPQRLDEMIEISEKLSDGFKHVRVDLYYTNGNIFFGELTFTHGSGQEKFTPHEFGYTVGEWLQL